MTKNLFGVVVIVSENVINHTILVSIQTIKIASAKIKLVDKLVKRSSTEECIENIDEVKIADENEYAFCYAICVTLAAIALAISIGIGGYFAYSCCYLKKVWHPNSVELHSNNNLMNGIPLNL